MYVCYSSKYTLKFYNQLLGCLILKGYHDVAVTLLLVVGEDLATALLEQMSLHQLR